MKQIPPEPESNDSDAIRIVLKTPSGKRLERRFHRNQSSKVSGRCRVDPWTLVFSSLISHLAPLVSSKSGVVLVPSFPSICWCNCQNCVSVVSALSSHATDGFPFSFFCCQFELFCFDVSCCFEHWVRVRSIDQFTGMI